jgi:RNA-directed DNA polymerase
MHDQGKSDEPVVPMKQPNNAGKPAAEAVEGRGSTKGNPTSETRAGHSAGERVPSDLDRVRQAAKADKAVKFTALFHHITIDRLRLAFFDLKKKAAAGIDGVTWKQYAEDLEVNLQTLHDRLQRGAYRAKPSRRVYIPKADGRQRPLGIASLEDKLVQRASVEVLNAVYEVDFLGFSYGFRPGRGQHDALDALAYGIQLKKVNWVLDADIRGFFDALDHEWLLKFIGHRIADQRILRLIQKWLAAGVMENGRWTASELGSPQGATVSPLLANIYLHYVFDLWFQQWRKRHATGDVIAVRYADDFVVGFQEWKDAQRFLVALRTRMRKFALELHPDKTRLIEFGRFAASRRERAGRGRPATFKFLGFTHICGETQNGKFLLIRHTIRERMTAKLAEVKAEIQQRRHLSIPEQGKWLGSVVRGFNAYYAVPTNIQALNAFRRQVTRHWLRALRRRGQRDRTNWKRMSVLELRYLPKAEIRHPWPVTRFEARTRGRSPVR